MGDTPRPAGRFANQRKTKRPFWRRNPKTAGIAAPDPSRGKTLVYEMIAPNKERGTI